MKLVNRNKITAAWLVPSVLMVVCAYSADTNGVDAAADSDPAPSEQASSVSNKVIKAEVTTNMVIRVADTQFETTSQDTNAAKAIQGDGATNVVVSVQADEESSWESAFSDDYRVPFYINFYMRDGLYYEFLGASKRDGKIVSTILSDKRRITGKIGIKIHEDWAYYKEEDDLPNIDNGFSLRRARVSTYGRTYLLRPVTYGIDIGVEDGDFFFYAGYLWLHEIPYVKSFKAGVFRAPFSLEGLQSSSTIPMMERAAPVDAFSPGERVGMQLGGAIMENKGTLHGGIFGGTYNKQDGETSSELTRVMARATWLPLDAAKSKTPKLIHIGGSVGVLYSDEDEIRYRARPESYGAPRLVDTGELGGDHALSYGLEAAWQVGPASLQGEFFWIEAEDAVGTDYQFFGGYLTWSYFLTGETRPYNRQTGTFSRLVPRRSFSFAERHWGAWEWSARSSYLDLSDGDIHGGKMSVLSTGLNCYLSRNTRVMFNVGMARVRDTLDTGTVPPEDGKLYYFQTRFQFEF